MSFSLFMPKLELGSTETHELCPGHTLRRAKPEEIDQIREFVGESRCFGASLRAYYECKVVKEGDEHLLMEQPRDRWMYCVVHFDGADENLIKLEYALDFLPIGAVLAITLLDSGASRWNLRYLAHGVLQRLLSQVPSTEVKFPIHLLTTVRSIFHALKPLEQADPALRPFRQFHSLKQLPGDSDAYVLGLFSVIEMVLTHKPGENLHDSLRHQVSAKMDLLSKRFMKNDLYGVYPSVRRSEVWKALYDWRSLLAHGETVDFTKGALQKLETADKARLFLDLNVRLLLKTFIDDAELIADLKRC